MPALIIAHGIAVLFAMNVGQLASEYCRDHKYVSNPKMDVSCVSMKQLDEANNARVQKMGPFGVGRK